MQQGLRTVVFVIIGAGLIAGYFSVGPWITFGAFLLVALVFGGILVGAHKADPKVDMNGEILEIMQSYTNRGARILMEVRQGTGSMDEYWCVKAQEDEFMKRVEIDPTDGRCLWRWKR